MALQGQYARNKARRNRNVNAHIDETLFGDRRGPKSGRASGRNSRGQSAPNGASVVSASYLNSARGSMAPGAKNSVVVTTSELYDIQNKSIILTAAEKQRQKKEREAARNEVARIANLRKERMLRMEEEKKKRAQNLTETEKIALQQNEHVLVNAKQSMDEELDDVKHMNQMMLYAKCATIRDVQLREKQKIQEEMAAQEKRLDTEMEVARIRQIKMLEDREVIRATEQKIGAQCIIQQIQEREAERVRQQEIRDQESAAMIQKIKLLEEKDKEEKLAKIEVGKKMMVEVMQANNAQARAKLRAKEQEMQEDMRIIEYLKAKEAREAAKEADLAQVKQEKELEVARLRAQQEKAQDRQAQVDELRAKRYQEEDDRRWRAKQLAEAKKKSVLLSEVAVARELQRREKAKRMAEQAQQEREEYYEVLEWNRVQAEQEQSHVASLKVVQDAHREEILNQISEHEMEKALARQKFLQEGQSVARQMEQDKRKLVAIKAQKLAQLRAAGVPQKYQAELAKKRVLVSTIH